MLAHSLRRWPSITSTLGVVFDGTPHDNTKTHQLQLGL